MKIEMRREVEFVIGDFLNGPLDADALERLLANRKLAIAPADTEEVENRIIRNTLNAVTAELEEAATATLIEPKTRERVKAIPIDDAFAAVENIWSGEE